MIKRKWQNADKNKIHRTTKQFGVANSSDAAETNVRVDNEEFDGSGSSLLNPVLELIKKKEKILQGIRESYGNAIGHFKNNNFSKAEEEFVKTIKPALSKPLKKKIIIADCPRDIKEMLLDSMNHLGQIYLNDEHVKQCGYTNNYAKAAMIFQYCAKFTEKYQDEISNWQEQKDFFLYEAYKVEFEFLKTLDKSKQYSLSDQQTKIQFYKDALSKLRLDTKKELTEEINPFGIDKIAERTKRVEDLYTRITKFFVNKNDESSITSTSTTTNQQGLLNQLLEECYSQLAHKPEGCEFAVIGLGSIAGGKMTPYSDLEFAILINEDKPEYKEYLQNLTKLLHIKVINYFQESVVRSLGIESLNNFKTGKDVDDWFWDDINDPGLSFDGPQWYSGKLPFGRKGYIKEPDFDLILTPQQMSEFQAEINNTDKVSFKTDWRLVQALRHISVIDGSKSLVNDYRQVLQTAISQEIVQERACSILQKDLKKFELKLGDEEEGKLFNVKKDIHRLSDRIIDALCDYHSISASPGQNHLTIWDKINKMQEAAHLSKEGAQHLKEAVSIATELRLATYLHNKNQHEGMSTYVPAVSHLNEEEKKHLLEKTLFIKEYYKENGTDILHHLYYVMYKLQFLVSDIHNNGYHKTEELRLSNDGLLSDTAHIKGLVHARFLEYDMAYGFLTKATNDNSEDFNILESLYFLCIKIGKIDDSIEVGHKIQKILGDKYQDNPNYPAIAESYNNLGTAYSAKREFDKAIQHYNKSLDIRQKAYASSPNHPAIAESYNNLGTAYSAKGEFDKVIKHYNKSLEIRQKAYASSPNHHAIAESYNNLGTAYHAKGEFEKGIENYIKSLEIMKVVYASSPNHPDIASSYNNLGIAYCAKGELDNAIEHHKQSLEIRKVVYASSPNHPAIAESYNNLGNAYNAKGEFEKGIENYIKSLEIRKVVYASSPNHPDIASSYNNLGLAYHAKGELDNAIEHHKQSLEIRKVAYASSPNHPDVAACYNNLGNVYIQQQEFDKAIARHTKSLGMMMKMHNVDPRDRLSCYNGLGSAYKGKKDYDQVIKYAKLCMSILEELYGEKHVSIVRLYNTLGTVYEDKKNINQAIEHYTRSTKIVKELLSGVTIHLHREEDTIRCIVYPSFRLGEIHREKGKIDDAINYYEQPFAILKKIYGDTLNEQCVADCCGRLGELYYAQGNIDKSISYHKQLLGILRKTDPNHPNLAALYGTLGNSYRAKGEQDKAIISYKQSLKMMDPSNQEIGGSYCNLGYSYADQGNRKEAIIHFTEAIQQMKKHRNHPDLPKPYIGLGDVYREQGDVNNAIAQYLQSLEESKTIYGIDHHCVLSSYKKLAITYSDKGEFEEAIEYLVKARNTMLSNQYQLESNTVIHLAKDHFVDLKHMVKVYSLILDHQRDFLHYVVLSSAANFLYDNVKVDEAIAANQLALIFAENNENATDRAKQSILYNAGCLYNIIAQKASSENDQEKSQGYISKAEESFQKALSYASNLDNSAGLYTEYANFLIRQSKYKEAFEYLQKAIQSNDKSSGLQYGEIEKEVVTDVIKHAIENSNEKEVKINAKEYAYYLIIANYNKFVSSGINAIGDKNECLEQFRQYTMSIENEIPYISCLLLANACYYCEKMDYAAIFAFTPVVYNMYKLEHQSDCSSTENNATTTHDIAINGNVETGSLEEL